MIFGIGVASFRGCLLDKHGITLSFVPNDEHAVQIQFALERVLAILVMVGDLNLLKPNRIFRTEGYFVWSTLPAYHKDEKD
ncbi:hypothetical protein VitviT2T_010145 [Vitis vinifera]|uniref:Methyltransferase n=1 Tax=Vitis vinifera TaxID=29760 RepID=A0ABY9C6W9_VITVI|nr:hypothetical protein VitviT2T_010145 [Vitis vinifera]